LRNIFPMGRRGEGDKIFLPDSLPLLPISQLSSNSKSQSQSRFYIKIFFNIA
jgi:hypothetical protein